MTSVKKGHVITIMYLFNLSCGVLHPSLPGELEPSKAAAAGLKPSSINNFIINYILYKIFNYPPLLCVSVFMLYIPAQGMQILNSRTLGKVSRPRLLLRVCLSPEVDPWLCSETGGLTFDLPCIQGTVFTDRITGCI